MLSYLIVPWCEVNCSVYYLGSSDDWYLQTTSNPFNQAQIKARVEVTSLPILMRNFIFKIRGTKLWRKRLLIDVDFEDSYIGLSALKSYQMSSTPNPFVAWCDKYEQALGSVRFEPESFVLGEILLEPELRYLLAPLSTPRLVAARVNAHNQANKENENPIFTNTLGQAS